jgi:hypothetical protein
LIAGSLAGSSSSAKKSQFTNKKHSAAIAKKPDLINNPAASCGGMLRPRRMDFMRGYTPRQFTPV